MTRHDPYRNFRFRLEIDGIQRAGFSEVSGLQSEVSPVEYREGTDPTHVRKLTGLTMYGNITLKWGVTDSLELYEWHRQIINGDISRRTIAIILSDEAGNDTARWEIHEAWPSTYSASDLHAKGNEVAIEILEICHEGVSRVR